MNLRDTFVNIIFENAILRYVYIYVVLYISSEVIQLLYDASIIINMYINTVPADDIYNIRTLSVNIKFICTSFRNRQNSEPLASFSCLFRSEYK
jgi:hypothetical protein